MTPYKFFSVLFVVFIFLSCEKEPVHLEHEEYDGLWIPRLSVQRGNKSAVLNWYEPQFYPMNIIPPHFANPDFVDIYISKWTSDNFEKFKTVRGDITSFEIEGLENEIPHLFYVVLRKEGFNSLSSKKTMVIPAENESTTWVYNGKRYSLGMGNTTKDMSDFAFTNWNFKWDGGKNCCIEAAVFTYSDKEKKATVIDTFSYSPMWDTTGESLVYVRERNEIAHEGHRPSHLVVYDRIKKTFRHFVDSINETRYPDWKNGNVSIVSVKKPPNSGLEIWEMQTESGVTTKLVSSGVFAGDTLLNPDKPDVSTDSKNVFFEAARTISHGGPTSIWQYSCDSKIMHPVFQTQWNDSNPAISPNGELLAFVSNRSGKENIWVYHLKNNTFKQITGSCKFYIRQQLGRISWANNNTLVFCGGVDDLEGIFTVAVPEG